MCALAICRGKFKINLFCNVKIVVLETCLVKVRASAFCTKKNEKITKIWHKNNFFKTNKIRNNGVIYLYHVVEIK